MQKTTSWLALAALLLLSPALGAIERTDFDRIVDFSVTLKALDAATGDLNSRFYVDEKILILNGTVTNVQFLSPEPENFSVQVELVSGEWIGLEEVRSYRCAVLFEGPEYFRIFPKRVTRGVPGIVGVNDRVLVVAQAVDPGSDRPDSRRDWMLKGFHIRLLP